MKYTGLFTLLMVCSISAFAKQQDDLFVIKAGNMPLIEKAWQINTSGAKITSYYSLNVNGRTFPGIRPFGLRWDMFKDLLDYTGKNILELGCCTALPSITLKKYREAGHVVAVDMADYRLLAAQLVAKAFEVSLDFRKLNLDNDNYEKQLGYDFDVVFCMSLLNWVKDKNRLMAYLSHFKNVIFEGHEHPTVEIARFARYGFNNYKLLGVSDLGRSVILFYR